MQLATVTLLPLSCPHQQTQSLFWFGLIYIIWLFYHVLFCQFFYLFFFLFDAYIGFIVIALFILLCFFFFCVCVFVCVCFVNFLCLCASLFVWSFGNLGTVCVCDGQMPFPPEYLAPPAERMKKEKKTKTPKNKKEPTGKVREEKGK